MWPFRSSAVHLDTVLAMSDLPLRGRWSALEGGAIVAVPARRRRGEARLSLTAARAVVILLEQGGSVFSSSGALVLEQLPPPRHERVAFRARQRTVATSGLSAVGPRAIALIAAHLMLGRLSPDLSRAYGELLAALANGEEQFRLDEKLAHTADELALALRHDIPFGRLRWQTDVELDDLPAPDDRGAVSLGRLLRDPQAFAQAVLQRDAT